MNTTATQAPAQVIEAQRTDKGTAFELPFDAAAVGKIESVDLDLLITLKDGQQFILTQAGLLAMTQPDSVLRYAGGLEVLAADEVKQIGAMQSMDANTLRLAGNFRLASLELDENDIDRVSGTGFGLGQELVDITAKLDQSSQKIESMLQSLEQATQASRLASSGDEPPPAVSTGVKRLSKNTNPDLYSSPTPGTPPELVKKEDQTNENTSNFTTNNTNNNVNNNTSTADAVTPKVTASLLAANKSDVTFQNVALSQTEVRQLLGKNSVELTMSATAQNLQFEAGKVENQLLLESVPATTSLLVNINDQQPGFKIPDGLTINGQAIRPGTPLTLDIAGIQNNEVPLNLQWEEGAAAAASNFQMTVSYIGPNGETTLKTLTFTGNADNAYTLDVNGEPRQFITSQAADLVVTANDQNNTITTGNGNDTIKGSGGADTINGGNGTDTVDYSNSAEAITLNAITGKGTGGQAAGDQLINIERVVGSNASTDTLDFSGAASAVTVDFVNGTTNVGLSFSGFENAIGSAHGDTYVVNNTQFGISESADGLGIDTVQASVDYTLGEHLENLELTGTAVNGTGNASNNTITGNSADNRLDGGAGEDTLIGGAGDDTYVVDNASDVVTEAAGEGSDNVEASIDHTLATSVENLTLTGGADLNGKGNELANTLTGNSGNNSLDGQAGADTMIGGGGNDIYVVDDSGDKVTEVADQGTDTVQSSITYTLGDHLENLTLTGNTAVNGTGNTADNTLTGNGSANTLDGKAGVDTMIGGGGNDIYVVDNAGDKVTEVADQGSDTVQSSITYTLGDHLENLTLTGTAAINGTGNDLANTINGNSANNRLDGGLEADTMAGGAGDDTYVVDHINDVVTEVASAGNDTIEASVTYTLSANVEKLILTEGSGNINGTGNDLVNTLTGNSGNNRLDGGAGIDTMIGGAGDDTYVVDNTGDVITEIANEGTDTVESSASYTIKDNIENLILKEGSGSINGTGNGLDNNILGNSGNNFLVGGLGNDTLNGGGGNDTASYTTSANITATLGLNGANGSATGEGTDVLINIENLKGGSGNDDFKGNELANKLEGGGGNDTLNGYAGNDTLDGGIGADSMTGGLGDDIYVVDNTGDVVVEVAGEGTDTVQSSITYILGENLENLTLTGSNAINGTGNSANNILTGNSSANRLDGGLGADTMAGGAGDDIYVVDNSGDVVTEAASAGTDTIEASVSYTLSANVEKLILKERSGNIDGTAKEDNNDNNTLIGNTGNNKLSGGGGNDSLIGGEGNDSLQGGAGNDTLVGSAGDDTLNGGTGNDTLNLRTDNTSLMGDRADGDDGNDTIEIAQSQLAPSLTLNTNSISGGTGSDTLQFHASVAGELNLTNILDTNKLNALNSFETLDLSKDNIASRAVISSSLIQGLVDNGNNSSLTLVLSKASGAQDTYTIATGENYSIGQNSSNQTVFTFQDTASIQIAQLTISYV